VVRSEVGLLPSGGIWVDVGHITARAGLESTLSSCGVSPMQTFPWTRRANAEIQGVSVSWRSALESLLPT
jgi:hypothetical protein